MTIEFLSNQYLFSSLEWDSVGRLIFYFGLSYVQALLLVSAIV